ncbi:MAG: DoxX family protein [Candidatus Competibacter sp.]|nr:DoxX family protein [Candidatus Competibacter sp.]MDG4582956.1 DoxX family protein [Candidatus Competibacter sp.]
MLLAETMNAAARPRPLAWYFALGRLLERLAPLTDLLLRLAVFRIFFWSGLAKINDWSSTLLLFEHEYGVPLLPHTVAAVLATGAELGASLLVLIGFLTRLAALPLLGIALVIQFVLGAADPAYNQLQHYLWMALLLALIARGPGAWSLDAWLERRSAPA